MGAVVPLHRVGKIQAVDTTANTVTVRVHLASRGAADYLGDDLTIAVAADAHVYKAVGARLQAIRLGDLVVGEKLRVEGTDRLLDRVGRLHRPSPGDAPAADQ